MRTILVSAYACEPLKGSEQGVGWNWVLQMAKNNYLHVITRANNQELIEEHIPQELKNNITFHYYDTHTIIKNFKNKAKGLYLYYFFWQLGIMPLVKDIIKKNKINYTMHLTMGSVWMPTFLNFFNAPFIWGPVGGGDNEPKSFSTILPFKARVIHYFRRFLNATASLNPFIRLKSKKAVAILSRTNNTVKLFQDSDKSKIKVVLETAMEPEIFDHKVLQKQTDEIKLITTGRLMPSKNIISLIRALKNIENKTKIQLTIIGSGPEKKNILKEANYLPSLISVKIFEEMPRKEVLLELQSSDIYVFPSLREGGSWALMEAMAIGLPVICLDWTGMAIITDKTSAVQLPVTSPEQMQYDLAVAIEDLINKPEKRKQIGRAARLRIKEEFNWESKGEFIEKLLEDLDRSKT